MFKPSLNQINCLMDMITDRQRKIDTLVDISDSEKMWDILSSLSFRQYQYIKHLVFENKKKKLKDVLINIGFTDNSSVGSADIKE